jgi:hypothetical protein
VLGVFVVHGCMFSLVYHYFHVLFHWMIYTCQCFIWWCHTDN